MLDLDELCRVAVDSPVARPPAIAQLQARARVRRRRRHVGVGLLVGVAVAVASVTVMSGAFRTTTPSSDIGSVSSPSGEDRTPSPDSSPTAEGCVPTLRGEPCVMEPAVAAGRLGFAPHVPTAVPPGWVFAGGWLGPANPVETTSYVMRWIVPGVTVRPPDTITGWNGPVLSVSQRGAQTGESQWGGTEGCTEIPVAGGGRATAQRFQLDNGAVACLYDPKDNSLSWTHDGVFYTLSATGLALPDTLAVASSIP